MAQLIYRRALKEGASNEQASAANRSRYKKKRKMAIGREEGEREGGGEDKKYNKIPESPQREARPAKARQGMWRRLVKVPRTKGSPFL